MTWAELKSLVNLKSVALQCAETDDKYRLSAKDGSYEYRFDIWKAGFEPGGIDVTQNTADRVDYLANWASIVNRPIVPHRAPFADNSVKFCGNAVVAYVVPIDMSKNLDLLITSQKLLNGGMLFVQDAEIEDSIKAQVVDVDSIIPEEYRGIYPNWPILHEWIEKWGVFPGQVMDLITPQAGEILPGFYLRMIYTAVGGTARKVTINYRLNEKV